MRFIEYLVCVCLVCTVDAASLSRYDEESLRGPSSYDNVLFYNLFVRLMSNGGLSSWINNFVLRPGGSSSGFNLGSDTSSRLPAATSQLSIERDRDPVFKTTTPSSNSNTESTLKPNKKFTIPIVHLTGSDSNVKTASTPDGLTIIRDYPQLERVTSLPFKRQKRANFLMPMIKLDSKQSYSNPGDKPPTGSLTDETGEDLVMVRDKDSNVSSSVTDPSTLPVERDREQGPTNPTYVTGSDSGPATPSASPFIFKIVPCGSGWCFKFT